MLNWAFIEEKIREGKVGDARDKLADVVLPLPREECLPFANLCRRSGLPQVGLRALRPWVRPAESQVVISNPKERVEYAACLQWLGMRGEAHRLLDSVDPKSVPLASMIRAFLLFSEWDYASAASCLEAYLQAAAGQEYERFVVNVNLLSAYVHLRKKQEAEALLAALKPELKQRQLLNLLGNALKQELELAVDEGDRARIRNVSREIKRGYGDPFSDLYLQKWLAIAELRTNRNAGETSLGAVKLEALRLGQFETSRDCDYHLALAREDVLLGSMVFHGTPYRAYRERFRKDAPWFIPNANLEIRRYPDILAEGRIAKEKTEDPLRLKPGSVLARLSYFLLSDSYSAPTTFQLFAAMFPGQIFHDRQTNLVHQALHRLRAHFRQIGIACEICERNGRFFLRGKKWLPANLNIFSRSEGFLAQISKEFYERRFSVAELAAHLGENARLVQRRIRELPADKVRKIKIGRKVSYELT